MKKSLLLSIFILFAFCGFSQNPLNAFAGVATVLHTSGSLHSFNEAALSFKSSNAGPLPAELISFDAELNNQEDVTLTWKTAIEKNTGAFIIQRMNTDGEISDVAEIKSNGSYSAYLFTDFGAEEGVNQYRLNQVGDDGSFNLKNWISISHVKTPGDFTLYPNITTQADNFTIECTRFYKQKITIEIFNALGQSKYMANVVPENNDSKYPVETTNWLKGVYFVHIAVNGAVTMKKIIVE